MAKIEAWEERTREEMEEFARQINSASTYALAVHAFAHEDDPENVPAVDPDDLDDPKILDRLVPAARKHVLISTAIWMVIKAEEDEDSETLQKAMSHVISYTKGMTVTLGWIINESGYRLSRVLEPVIDEKGEEKHPLVTSSLIFSLDDYLTRYRDIVHLGVCRHCGDVYLKPKHGRKQRYCSRACQQKAYRERKAEREAGGGWIFF